MYLQPNIRLSGIDVNIKDMKVRVLYGVGAVAAASTIMASGIFLASKI